MKYDKPIMLAPYKLSKLEEAEMQRQLNKLDEARVIEKWETEYGVLAFWLKKPKGNMRLVVDLSKLNTYNGIEHVSNATN